MDRTARAQHLLDLDRPAEALNQLRAVLADSPSDAQALALTSVAHLALDQPSEALSAADAMVAARPEFEWGHRLRSQALGELRRRHEAMAAAAEAVRLDPQGWAGHAQYALSAVHLPQEGGSALAAARHAVELAPHEPDAHFAVGYVADRLARPEESDAAYRRTLALDPSHTAARNNLTVASGFSLGLGRRARGFAQVLRDDPTQVVARRNLERVGAAVLVRVHVGALVVLVVTTAVASSGAGSPARFATAAVGLAAVVLGGAVLTRQLPDGVLSLARAEIPHRPFLVALTLLFVVVVAATIWVGLAPYQRWFVPSVLQPLGLLNVVLLVWAVSRGRGDG